MANDIVKNKVKSFWDKPEGTTGMIVGAGFLGLLGYGAYKVMPYIADLMMNTAYAIGFGLLAFALLWVFVIDGTMRNRMWLMYKLMMRALTYMIISYDPIGVLRETQKKAKERIKTVQENRDTVKGQVSIIQQTLEGFQNDEKRLLAEIAYMQRNNKPQEDINNNAQLLGKTRQAETRMQKSLDMTSKFDAQLLKALKALKTIDSNIDFEINLREREYKAVNASNTAWKAVRNAFNGNDEIDQLRNDTFAWLAEDYGNKLGQIDSFMEDSQKFIDGADMNNALNQEEGFRILEDLNSRKLDGIVQSVAVENTVPGVLLNNQTGATIPVAGSINYTKSKQ